MLEIKNLSFCFYKKEVLKNINLKIDNGEFILIGGNNGSGKTVLVRHFNGLFSPSSGEILFHNIPISKMNIEIKKKVGMVFQDADTQIIGQTVYDDIAFGLENLKVPRKKIKEIVQNVIKEVGLEGYEHNNPQELSGGEKKRVIIAGILAMKPDIIVFDEPFTGLDFPGVKQVLSQMVRLHKSGHTIVVVTHDFDKILAHASRVIVLKRGTIIHDIALNQNSDIIPNELYESGLKISYGNKSEKTWLK